MKLIFDLLIEFIWPINGLLILILLISSKNNRAWGVWTLIGIVFFLLALFIFKRFA